MPQKKIVASILCGLCLGLLLKGFVFDILFISGESMEPALRDGEFVFFNKLAYGVINPFNGRFLVRWAEPQKDDIVIFHFNDRKVIKRCVAVAGETLAFSDDSEYSMFVGGKHIPLEESQYQRLKYSSAVPDGTILAIGDNYEQSTDSRDYGFICVQSVLGKIP